MGRLLLRKIARRSSRYLRLVPAARPKRRVGPSNGPTRYTNRHKRRVGPQPSQAPTRDVSYDCPLDLAFDLGFPFDSVHVRDFLTSWTPR